MESKQFFPQTEWMQEGIAAGSTHRTLSCLGPRVAVSVAETEISACC